jgi:hypothetical protein
MSLLHSPQITTNGLVLYYDMYNTKKSFKGAPTTNMLTNGNGQGATSSVPPNWGLDQPWGGLSPTTNSSGVDSSNRPYYQFSIAGTTTVSNRLLISPTQGFPGVTVTAGQSYAMAYDVKLIAGNYPYTLQMTFLWYDASSVYLSASLGTVVTPTTTLARYSDVAVAPANAAKLRVRFDFTGYSTIGSVVNFTMQLGECQLEPGTFSTPYLPTTTTALSRTASQSILDITNQTTLTSTGLIYSASPTFSFDGTTSTISSPVLASSYSSGSFTIESVFKFTSAGHNQVGIMGFNNVFNLKINATAIITDTYSATSVRNVVTSVPSFVADTWYYICSTFSAGTVKTYCNGVLTTTVNTGENLRSSADILTFGNTYGYFMYAGLIPTARFYNRALTSAEVYQNFNAIRGRYGL